MWWTILKTVKTDLGDTLCRSGEGEAGILLPVSNKVPPSPSTNPGWAGWLITAAHGGMRTPPPTTPLLPANLLDRLKISEFKQPCLIHLIAAPVPGQ